MQTTTGTSLASLFISVSRLLKARLERELPMPFSQYELLRVVEELKNPSMRDLAERFNIAAPSVTTLVEPLVKAKYVLRQTGTNDRRQVRLALTQKGITAKARIEKKRSAVIDTLLSSLNKEDVTNLRQILIKIIASAS